VSRAGALVDTTTISGYLDAVGWHYLTVQDDVVITSYRCRVTGYFYVLQLEMRISAEWVYVRSLLQRDVDPRHRTAILRLISRWNLESHRVKFVMASNCVVVQAEIAQAQCHVDSFREALYAVCRYGELSAVELATVASDPAVADLYDELNRAPESETAGHYVALAPEYDFELVVNTIPDDQ
jgi:hypothetical protein